MAMNAGTKGTLYTLAATGLLAVAGFLGRQVWTMYGEHTVMMSVLEENKIIELSGRVSALEKENENMWALLQELTDDEKKHEVEIEVIKRLSADLILPFIAGMSSFNSNNLAQNGGIAPSKSAHPNAALNETIDKAREVIVHPKEQVTTGEFKKRYVQQRQVKARNAKK